MKIISYLLIGYSFYILLLIKSNFIDSPYQVYTKIVLINGKMLENYELLDETQTYFVLSNDELNNLLIFKKEIKFMIIWIEDSDDDKKSSPKKKSFVNNNTNLFNNIKKR